MQWFSRKNLSQGDQIFRLVVNEGSPLVGRSLADSINRGTIPAELLVIAIEQDGKKEIPTSETVVTANEVLTFFSLERVSDDLIEKLTG